jgi:hypothetical protein
MKTAPIKVAPTLLARGCNCCWPLVPSDVVQGGPIPWYGTRDPSRTQNGCARAWTTSITIPPGDVAVFRRTARCYGTVLSTANLRTTKKSLVGRKSQQKGSIAKRLSERHLLSSRREPPHDIPSSSERHHVATVRFLRATVFPRPVTGMQPLLLPSSQPPTDSTQSHQHGTPSVVPSSCGTSERGQWVVERGRFGGARLGQEKRCGCWDGLRGVEGRTDERIRGTYRWDQQPR